MDKSGACVDSVYQALFSRRAGNEARCSHNCLARIKKTMIWPHLTFPPSLYLLVFTYCMVLYASY